MLKLLGDTASIDKSLKGTQGRLRSTASAAGSWLKAAGIGLAIEGVGKLTEALGDAWDGFRDGEKASGQLATTWENFNVKGANLQKTIDKISATALKLGTDDTEAIGAFNKALQATGGDPKKAMDRLRIAQDLVANGSAPNLSSAMKIIQQAANGSKRTVDQFGLTADTAGGRIRQLGQRVQGAAEKAAALDPLRVALNGVGEGLETIVGSLSKGDIEGALGGIAAIGTSISEAWTNVFPAVDKAMTSLIGEETWGKVKSAAQGALDAVSGTVERLGQIWDGLAPHVQNALDLISPLIDGMVTIVGLMGDNIRLVLDAIGALLNGDFSGAWTAVQGIVENVGTAIQTAINAVLTFLQGILPGIGEAARGIGDAIFQGIVTAIGGLADTVRAIFDGAVTALRDAWNSLDFAIPAFNLDWAGVSVPNPTHGTIADIFGTPAIQILPPGNFKVWDGTGDLIPDFAKGGIVKARPGGLIGRIGEAGRDEAVIPLDRMGGLRGLGDGTVQHVHSGTVRIDITPGAASALRQAGYSPADIADLSARLERQNRMQSVAYARMGGED